MIYWGVFIVVSVCVCVCVCVTEYKCLAFLGMMLNCFRELSC